MRRVYGGVASNVARGYAPIAYRGLGDSSVTTAFISPSSMVTAVAASPQQVQDSQIRGDLLMVGLIGVPLFLILNESTRTLGFIVAGAELFLAQGLRGIS